jgi:hypothetical protein
MGGKIKMNKMLSVFALGMIVLMGVGFIAAYQGDYSVKGPNHSEDRYETMEQIFDSLDYDAWVSFMTENGRSPRVLEVVNKDNFVTFVEAREAFQSGNLELAREFREELDLNNGKNPKDGTGFRRGFNQGMNTGFREGRGSCVMAE